MSTEATSSYQTSLRRPVHPHRFMLWLSMASVIMLFTGFTSAYIVKHADTNNWTNVDLPSLFWVSTTFILMSSLTMAMAVRSFKRHRLTAYRSLVFVSLLLGGAFLVSQIMAWQELVTKGLPVGTEIAADFLYVISGAHFLHVIGGLVAILFLAVRAWIRYRQPEDMLLQSLDSGKVPGIELVATYWHFVDLLWLYLFVFFIANT